MYFTVSLPVPWGQIAGKAWGNPDGKPVLALHGVLQHNSNLHGTITRQIAPVMLVLRFIMILSSKYYMNGINHN